MSDFKVYPINPEGLPLVIESTSKISITSFLNLLSEKRSEFESLLFKHGGLLFRGFPLKDARDFALAVESMDLGKPVQYIGGDSPRTKIEGAVYTSTEAPPSLKIPLHNELSFVKNYPNHIYFFCETPPLADGETILGDARTILKKMDPGVKKRFASKNLRYYSAYYNKSTLMELLNKWQRSHKSWPEVFETSDPKEVERKCHEHEFGFKWTKNGWITIWQDRPATLRHPKTGDEVWFNQAHLYDFNPKFLGLATYLATKIFYSQKHMRLHEVEFGNGEKIPRSDLYHILDTLDANTIKFPWKQGDFLVLDNILAMHGRATFKGKRRILAAMTT